MSSTNPVNLPSRVNGKAADTSRVGGISNAGSSFPLHELANDKLDVKRWINSTLANAGNTSGESNDGGKTGANEAEAAVTRLFNRLQAHSQEVAVVVEGRISQTLLQLPRTSAEVSRMIEETQDIAQHVAHVGDIVKPAVLDDESQQRALRLKTLQQAKHRLEKCVSVLQRARELEQSMKKIDETVHQMQQKTPANAGSSGDGSGSSVDVDGVARAIADVKKTLEQLQSVDPHFGEAHASALHEYEQQVQQSVELECVQRLSRKDTGPTPSSMLRTLRSIGRDAAVLDEYARTVTKPMCKRLMEALAEIDGTQAQPTYKRNLVSALHNHFQTVSSLLEAEGKYLCTLAVFKDAPPEGSDPTVAGKPAMLDGSAASPTTQSGPNSELEGSNNSAAIVRVLTVMVKYIVEETSSKLSAALEQLSHNADLLACFDTQRSFHMQLSSATSSSTEKESTAASSSAATASSATGGLLKIGATVAAYAITEMTRPFSSKALIEAFCARECETVKRTLFSGGGGSGIPPAGKPSAPVFVEKRRGGQGALKNVTGAIEESLVSILHYFPEQTLLPCVQFWKNELVSALEFLRPTHASRSQPAQQVVRASRGSGDDNALARDLLDRVLTLKGVVRPVLLACQKHMIDLLDGGSDIAQRSPAVANNVLVQLKEKLWDIVLIQCLKPLIAQADDALRDAIVAPVIANVEGYESLPVWSGQLAGPGAHGSAASSIAAFTPGHISPSEAIRTFGEAIMEIPLTLEILGGGDEEAWKETSSSSSSGAGGGGGGASDGVVEDSQQWLENVVNAVLNLFVDGKVLRVVISVAPNPPPNTNTGTNSTAAASPPPPSQVQLDKMEAVAVEQLVTDLDFLQNILSAVSDAPFEKLVRVIEPLRALQLPHRKPIAVHEIVARSSN